MITRLTSIYVKPEQIEDFKAACVLFASASVHEPGLVSFALLQQAQDPSAFSLFDVYHDEQTHQAHLASEHYAAWQTVTQPMLAQPLAARLYAAIFPPPEDWERHLEA